MNTIQIINSVISILLMGHLFVIWSMGNWLNAFIKFGVLLIVVFVLVAVAMSYFSPVLAILSSTVCLGGILMVNGRWDNVYKFCYFIGICFNVFTLIRS
jgi:hypothetical protein